MFSLVVLSLVSGSLGFASLSVDEVNALNASVSGRLAQGIPYSRPCFQDVGPGVGGEFNATECAAVQAGNHVQDFRLGFYGSRMEINWETCQNTLQQCLLDSNNASISAAFAPPQVCSLGSISPYYIDVRTPQDVIAAFNVSRTKGIPVTIKNTGHDLLGRSSGPGTLGLWTHNLQNMSYSPSFVAKGCHSSSSSSAVTIGAGVVFKDMYAFADANNVTVLGGAYTTVGAGGGWIHGGGHSPISNAFGLGVDRVLEFEIVTPTGRHLIANACQNDDLFWALKGGGGSTFGVVLSVTFAALPKLTIQTYLGAWNSTNDQTKLKFLEFYTEHAVNFADAGFGGFFTVANSSVIVLANPLANATVANTTLQPLRDFILNELSGSWTFKSEPSYLSMYNDFIVKVAPPAGTAAITASRLVPASSLGTNSSRKAVAAAHLKAINGSTSHLINLTTPYKFSKTHKGSDTSVTPAWREAIWHFFQTSRWNFDITLGAKRAIYTDSSARMSDLRALTPKSGAYHNEADPHEPNYIESFWGSNYGRLLSIKNKYDPEHLLDCWHCVGWKGVKDPLYSCYI